MKERKLTGYPSIDKPWLKYYEGKISGEMLVPGGTVYDFLWQNNSVHPKDIALRYFWRKIDYRKLFSKIDDVETYRIPPLQEGGGRHWPSGCPVS